MRAAIILAAGQSRRFGRPNKLLAAIAGRPVLAHVLARACGAARRVILVTGHDRARVERVGRLAGAEVVYASDHAEGLAASLRAGLRRLRPIDREVLLYLGDMPFVPDPGRWRLAGADAVRPGRRGHPVLARTVLVRAIRIAGDQGLGGALRRVLSLPEKAGSVADLDTIAALRRARGSLRLIRALPPR